MSDIATTEIVNPAASPGTTPAEPFISWQGQPWSRESAGARRTALLNDKAYADAAKNGDSARCQELAALWQIEHYGSAPQPPQTFGDVERQMEDRASRETAEYAEHLRTTVNFSEQQVNEIVNRRPIPDAQHRWHQQQLATLKSDRDFVARYLRGDREAVFEMRRHISATALPVGTLAEIQAWEARYGLKGAA